MEDITIKNRDGKNLAVTIGIVSQQKGLAFIAHGLGGFKEQPQIQTFAKSFRESNYSTVTWDARNSIGESEGLMEDASITSYYQDLEDVVLWAKSQNWFQEPFVLCGHSVGGMIITLYTEKHPDQILALSPLSTVVSGKLTLEISDKEKLEEWKKTGVRLEESKSKPGVIKKLKWSYVKDLLRYDILKDVNKLTMPVLLIVGNRDESTPLKHQQIFFNSSPSKNKELFIIEGAEHTFRSSEHLEEVKGILKKWINSLE